MLLGAGFSCLAHLCVRVRSAQSLAGAPQAVPPLVVLLHDGAEAWGKKGRADPAVGH